MFGLQDIIDGLDLEQVAPDHYRAPTVDMGHGVVFGGQLLAQSMVAAAMGHDAKTVKTIHTVFARSASPDAPVDISVDAMHAGRALASSTVTVSQSGNLCTRSIVLLTADEPDLIRHADGPCIPSGPEDAVIPDGGWDAWETRVVGGADVNDPDAVGPAELGVWIRFRGAPEEPLVNQALLAFASDGFLIGTAMRPHKGVGQALAHKTISTGVVSHTLTFHEPFFAADWLLLAHRSPYAGRGRGYGRADVFGRDGTLVASFVQDSIIRAMPAGRSSRL
jgi:acyl-CoA thioesterase-2